MSQEIEPMTNNKIHTRSILFTKTRNKKHTLKTIFLPTYLSNAKGHETLHIVWYDSDGTVSFFNGRDEQMRIIPSKVV